MSRLAPLHMFAAHELYADQSVLRCSVAMLPQWLSKQRTSPSACARRRSWIEALRFRAVAEDVAALALQLHHAKKRARLDVTVVGEERSNDVDRAGALPPVPVGFSPFAFMQA